MEPLTAEQTEAAATFALLFITCTALVLGGVSALVGWVVNRGRVSTDTPALMSPAAEPLSHNSPSSLGTDRTNAPDGQPTPRFTREQLLTLYTLLRAHGVTREKARAALSATGIPLSNDVWKDAAPPPVQPVTPEPLHVTPIVGRPTSAQFHDEDLAYTKPPQGR